MLVVGFGSRLGSGSGVRVRVSGRVSNRFCVRV